MLVKTLKERFQKGAEKVLAAEEELTLIDSKFGDADHGLTMKKIASAIIEGCNEAEDDFKDLLDKINAKLEELNGGSAVPLWISWFSGFAMDAEKCSEISLDDLKRMFANGFEEFDFMSGAKPGEKTIMDALKPASDAIQEASEEDELFRKAYEAAYEGAMATKDYIARIGRAKSYGEKTIGTPDAGALSMAYFFAGMADR